MPRPGVGLGGSAKKKQGRRRSAEARNPRSSTDALVVDEVLMGHLDEAEEAVAAANAAAANAAAANAASANAAAANAAAAHPALDADPLHVLATGSGASAEVSTDAEATEPEAAPAGPTGTPPGDHQHLVAPMPVWVAEAPAVGDAHSPAHAPGAAAGPRILTPSTLMSHQRASLGLQFYQSSTPAMSPDMSSRGASPAHGQPAQSGMKRVMSRGALTRWDSDLSVDVIEARGLSMDGCEAPDVVVQVKLVQSRREKPIGVDESLLVQVETPVARGSGAPRWKDAHFESFRFEYSFFSSDRLALRLEVWGANPATQKTQVIGQSTLVLDDDLVDGQLFDEWVPLLPWYRQRGPVRGRLHIRVAFKSCETLASELEAWEQQQRLAQKQQQEQEAARHPQRLGAAAGV